MTKIKLCGLSRICDIQAVNVLKPDYIGFVFAKKSKRAVIKEQAAALKELLDPAIQAVGVFVKEPIERVAELLNHGIIDIAQLHGSEDEEYIRMLRTLSERPIIQAFRIDTEQDVQKAQNSSADFILLDSGEGGTGTAFDWNLLKNIQRPYFLAGGLTPLNVAKAIENTAPYAVDVSSGIETNGMKDREKMAAFVSAVREAERR